MAWSCCLKFSKGENFFCCFFFWKLHEEKKKNKTKNTILNSNNKIMDRKYPKFRWDNSLSPYPVSPARVIICDDTKPLRVNHSSHHNLFIICFPLHFCSVDINNNAYINILLLRKKKTLTKREMNQCKASRFRRKGDLTRSAPRFWREQDWSTGVRQGWMWVCVCVCVCVCFFCVYFCVYIFWNFKRLRCRRRTGGGRKAEGN